MQAEISEQKCYRVVSAEGRHPEPSKGRFSDELRVKVSHGYWTSGPEVQYCSLLLSNRHLPHTVVGQSVEIGQYNYHHDAMHVHFGPTRA